MTIKEVNKIFRTKYPDGEIVQRGCMGGASKVATCVIFKSGGKVYKYNVQNYVELLNKLGFKILYHRDVDFMENEIKRIEKIISDGGENNIFCGFIKLADSEKECYIQKIQQYKYNIKNSIVVNG